MRCITFSKTGLPCRYYSLAVWLFLGLLTGPLILAASGQGTVFTYQGRLTDGSGPANGSYDFRFRLAADPLGNNFVAGPVLTNAVAVSGGLFTVALDFGSVFTGSNYWLQIDVRTNGAGSYSTLTPLQALTPTPYAIFAGGASNLLGAVPAAQLSGTIGSAQLAGAYSNPLNFSNAANQFSGTFNGNGGALSNVNAAALGGLAASNFWQTSGNTGTSPSANFLGTTDNQPLEFRVNGQRVLRLTPNSTGGPNLLGGSVANVIAPGIVGGVIIGGGSTSYFGTPYTNSIASDFDFIGGGAGHSIGTNSPFSTIIGGTVNQIGANNSDVFIGGGNGNQIQDTSGFSTISGGLVNQIGTSSSQATVGGGGSNLIGSNDTEATIGGGGGNRILDNSAGSTIAGGSSNQILTNSTSATIAGGQVNQIRSFSDYSFIGGGNRNMVTNSQYAIIGGGDFNAIVGGPSAVIVGGNNNTNIGFLASIGGGEANVIQFAADHAVIAGGGNNTILGSLTLPVYDTIGGGLANSMQTNSIFSVIAGGRSNLMTAGASFSAISGGSGNTVILGAANATIAGGSNNIVSGPFATILGGIGNSAAGPSSVVVGGANNTTVGASAVAMGQNSRAGGNNSLAAGFGAQATNTGAFVWADQTGFNFSSTNDNSFNVHAAGGVRMVTSGAGLTLDGPLGVTSGAISGNGGSLSNVNASTLAGLAVSNFWKIGGNSGVTSNQFLGTVDANPLEFRANSFRALRLEPNTNGAPNVIGGSVMNRVAPGVSGAVIAGGGATNGFGGGPANYGNFVGGDYSTIAGGMMNYIEVSSAQGATIGGGQSNDITNCNQSIIGNGVENVLQNSDDTIIGGGFRNVISGNTSAVIGGGDQNAIGGFSGPFGVAPPNLGNTICGGVENSIEGAIGASTISGGFGNLIFNANGGMIPGGAYNVVQGDYSFAAGSNAVALGRGSFVWADAIGQPFVSSVDNQFLIRASAGVGIGKTNPATALDVNGTVTATTFAGNGFQLTGSSYITGGRLGVGTTAPDGPLHVASGSAGTVTANPNSIAVFEKSTSGYLSVLTPAGNEGGLLFGNPNNNTDGGIIYNNPSVPHGLEFRTGTNGNKMTIQAGGNVGIGTINPSRTLHLLSSGDTELGIQSSDASGHLWTLQSSGVSGSGRDATFQIIDRSVGGGESRLLITTNGFVGIGSVSPTNVLDVLGNISCSGNVFAHGVLLTSDRNAKENFATLNPETVLAKVASLPLTEWNYKGDAPDIKHVGPMAQDFQAAFGLNGNDNAHISAVDESGVALAAIQGLNQKLTEELQRRDAENAALKQRLERLEQLLERQSHNH